MLIPCYYIVFQAVRVFLLLFPQLVCIDLTDGKGRWVQSALPAVFQGSPPPHFLLILLFPITRIRPAHYRKFQKYRNGRKLSFPCSPHLEITVVYISVNFLLQIFTSLKIIKSASYWECKILCTYLNKPFYSVYKCSCMFSKDMFRKQRIYVKYII